MTRATQIEVPQGSLLAEFGKAKGHRDCFMREVPGEVSLPQFIERFYCSMAFRPERLVLSLIGKGASNADAAALARSDAASFAAWNVIARSQDEILLQDFQQSTASWLSVQPAENGTKLLFGSWVGKPESPMV